MICSYRSTLARRETYRVKNLLTPINAEHSLKVARTGECSFVFHQHWVSNHLPLVYEFADMHTIGSITVSKEPGAKMRDEVFAKVAAIVRKTLPIQVQLKCEGPASSVVQQDLQPVTKESYLPSRPRTPIHKARCTTAESDLAAVRRQNMRLLTRPFGAKTQLATIAGLSICNISHRLHGYKIFDTETAVMFCKLLRLPEDWLDVPRRDRDIPVQTVKLLTFEDCPHKLARREPISQRA